MDTEIWRTVPGYAKYEISKTGYLKRVSTGTIRNRRWLNKTSVVSDDGQHHIMTIKEIHRLAFPELH